MNVIRHLKVAAAAGAALLLAGCVTDPYAYRGGYGYGSGDYYYGRPSVEYRHYGSYGGYGYPYYGGPYGRPYGRSHWSFGFGYGYPYYGYGGYGYGWPYYYRGWPRYPPIVVHPRPDPDPDHDPGDDQGPPPWRDLDRLRDGGPRPPIQTEPSRPRFSDAPVPGRIERPRVERPTHTPRAPRASTSGGSRLERAQRMLQDREER